MTVPAPVPPMEMVMPAMPQMVFIIANLAICAAAFWGVTIPVFMLPVYCW